MDRKPKPLNFISPMPKKQFRKLVKEFEGLGGKVIMGEDVDEYLSMKNCEATTLDGYTILYGNNPGRAAVYEELIHAEQYRNNQIYDYESILVNEIQAQEILLEKAQEYELTVYEITQTKKALKTYKEKLKQFQKERRANNDDL